MAWGAGEALVMEEVEVSPPQSLEIRIKVVSTSLCRSDLSAWQSHVSKYLLFYHNIITKDLIHINNFYSVINCNRPILKKIEFNHNYF